MKRDKVESIKRGGRRGDPRTNHRPLTHHAQAAHAASAGPCGLLDNRCDGSPPHTQSWRRCFGFCLDTLTSIGTLWCTCVRLAKQSYTTKHQVTVKNSRSKLLMCKQCVFNGNAVREDSFLSMTISNIEIYISYCVYFLSPRIYVLCFKIINLDSLSVEQSRFYDSLGIPALLSH